MTSEHRNGAPGQGPVSQNISRRHHAANRDQDTALYVWSVAYPPSGRRRGWLCVVRTCPFCTAGNHAHRGGPQGGLKRAGCGRGSYYVKTHISLGAAA